MPVGAFVPSRIHLDYPEWQAPTGSDSGKVWAWNGSGYAPVSLAFDPVGTAAAAVAAHVVAENPHSQYYLASGVSVYGATLIDDADAAAARGTLGLGTMAVATETAYLLADGSRAGATSSRQVFTTGITTGSIRPPADSTAAFQVQTAGGTAVIKVDTANQWVNIGASGIAARLGIKGAGNNASSTAFLIQNSDAVGLFTIDNGGGITFGSTSLGQTNVSTYAGARCDFRLYSSGDTSNYLGFYTFNGAAGSAYGEFGFLNVGAAQGASINFDTRGGIAPYRFFVKPSGGSFVNAMDIFASAAVQVGTNNSEITSTRFAVKGAGATSATFAAKLVNSSLANLMSIRNDGYVDIGGTVQADGLRLDVTPTSETITPTHTITISLNGTNYKIPCVAA